MSDMTQFLQSVSELVHQFWMIFVFYIKFLDTFLEEDTEQFAHITDEILQYQCY